LSRQIRALLVVAMIAFGVGVYFFLAHSRSKSAQAASAPTAERGIVLPGTIYLAQAGSLYSYAGGAFTKLPSGPGVWMQPALTADRSQLVAVNRAAQSSDLYLLGLDGRVVKQLTHNQRSTSSLELNHWAYYPRPTSDGRILFSYDSPKFGFLIDLAVWQMPLGGTQAQGVRRTSPNDYTGGDVFPSALPSGGLLYAKYSIQGTGSVYSQLWLQLGQQTAGKELTQPSDDCGQPALSPDGTRVAMTCTAGQQTGRLEVAGFDGQVLGSPVTVATGQVASPAWAPDGSLLAYLAPGQAQGHFQLWTVSVAKSGKPAAPRQVTTRLDFDATSSPAWR
jgi:Tol biopolymer transport system component